MSDRQGKDDQTGIEDGHRSAQLLRLADFGRNQPARIVADMQDYWHRLRGDRAVPARADVEPRGIHRALDYAFILERIAPGAARFRLAGRHLIDLMGMEVRGMPLCAFLNPGSRGRLSDVLESVFKAPQIAELRLEAKADYARPDLTARLLLLPLRSDLGDVTRAMGCLIAEGETGVAPRRFDLVADQIMPIIQGGATVAPSPSGFGEDSSGFAHSRKPGGRPTGRGATATSKDQNSTPATDGAPEPASPEGRRAMFRVITLDD